MNTDRMTVQMVVGFIGLSSLLIIGGLIALAFNGRPLPDQLATLGGATIGALGSLLARTFTSEQHPAQPPDPLPNPLPVEIKNSPEKPVPVAGATPQEQGD